MRSPTKSVLFQAVSFFNNPFYLFSNGKNGPYPHETIPQLTDTDVLVAPIRVAERMNNMTAQEISDLFKLAEKIQRVVEKIHGANSSTVAVQDGPEAGQTIKVMHRLMFQA